MNQEPYFIGVDLGGTQLRMAAVTRTGQLATEMLSLPTGKGLTPAELVRKLGQLYAQIETLTAGHSLAALGVGVAGVIWENQLSESDNVPLLNDINLKELLQEAAHGLPVTLENDARCFVLAEARFGAGRGAQHVCGITLGTGCGGGVIANGQLVRGARGGAGEVWSIPLREHFLEYYVSGVGLVRTYQEGGGVADETTTSAQIADRARAGEAAAVAAWLSFGNDVALLCETMLALLEPEIIVIGGSIAQAHDLFGAKFENVRNHRHTRIAFAELGAAAGVIGAAALNF